jgi:hypothetical protein
MKNTTKLKHLLQLYTIALDMDEEGNFHLTAISKLNRGSATFVDRLYTVVVGKAFSHMVKEIKKEEKKTP